MSFANEIVDKHDEEIKTITFPSIRSKQQLSIEDRHLPRTRVVAETHRWTFTDEEIMDASFQRNVIMSMTMQHHQYSIVQTLIKDKIASYRHQDIKKQLFQIDKFVDYDHVIGLLQVALATNNTDMCICNGCYYCKEPIRVIYKYVRDPKQWTLERLNNSQGHNRGNVVIACLACNLKRRIMHHERYVKTKQMMTVRKTDGL